MEVPAIQKSSIGMITMMFVLSPAMWTANRTNKCDVCNVIIVHTVRGVWSVVAGSLNTK